MENSFTERKASIINSMQIEDSLKRAKSIKILSGIISREVNKWKLKKQ